MKLEKKLYGREGYWEAWEYKIYKENIAVGQAVIITSPKDDSETYVEWIHIEEEHRNKGLGTEALRKLAAEYGYIYFAPADEDNKRLYERIAEEIESNAPEVDQGFGVYYMEG